MKLAQRFKMQIQVLYYEKKVHFPTTKGLYGGDQPITCSHLEGDENQRQRGGERVKKGASGLKEH